MNRNTPVTDPPAASERAADRRDPRLLETAASPGGWWRAIKRNVRAGELGAAPVVIGLLIIAFVFQLLNDRFLSAQNLSNLTVQIAAIGLMTTGVIVVLLLGEIDLSIGSVAGLSAAVLALTVMRHGCPEWAGIAADLWVGLILGLFHGFLFVVIGVPVFVVTLAGLLGWQVLLLWIMSPDGTINTRSEGLIAALTQTYFVPWIGWALVLFVLALYLVTTLTSEHKRHAAGLPHRPPAETLLRAALLAVPLVAGVWILNQHNGLPLAFLIFVGAVVTLDLVLRKTRYGRMIYAVGGNAEAARRAGISTVLIRISVFGIASTLAALGGIMLVSRNIAASTTTGGGQELMMAIAAAVIGGTSLFGGRGNAYSALLGGLVLGAITSGLLLLPNVDTSVRFMITAAVLLVAVIMDAASRRGRKTHARGGG